LRFERHVPRNEAPRTPSPIVGEATKGCWKLIWNIPQEANEVYLNKLVEAARNDDLWSDDFVPVQEQRIQVMQQQLPSATDTEDNPVLAGLSDQSRTRLNPKIVEIYGLGLQSMNIDYITPIQSIIKQENNMQFTVKQNC
jgi:hypothetical protein